MNNFDLTIVVTTYNREDVLSKCLNSLFKQTLSQSQYEILIVDDGSDNETQELVKSVINNAPVATRYFRQGHKGPAAARNTGIKNAKGKIILFIGDDIIAGTSLLEEHYKFHRMYQNDNVAMLGFVTWSLELKITPFMRWLESNGTQFAFGQIQNKAEIDPRAYFYTANISLKRRFLSENDGFFDEDFPYAAYEDLELGYRLKNKGMILKYNRNAVGYHLHSITLNKYCRRMFYTGYSASILSHKYPEIFSIHLPETSLFKDMAKKLYYYLIGNIVSFLDYYFIIGFPNFYPKIMDYHKFEGIKEEY